MPDHRFPHIFLFLLFPGFLIADKESSLPQLADAPVGVASFGAAFHDDAIYMFGGHLGVPHSYSRDEVSKPLYRLAFDSDAEWEELASNEPALGPALLSHSSGIIRIGGMQPRNAKGEEAVLVSVPFVRRFDPETGKWSKLPNLPKGRSSHDAWIVGDKIYVAGGWQMRGPDKSSKWSTTVDILDLSAEKPEWRSIPQPFMRRALAVAAHDNKLYCMGGLEKDGGMSEDIDVLDLETEEWSEGPMLPIGHPMKGFGLAAAIENADGRLYITGLSGKVHALGEDGKWEQVGKMKTGRFFARLVDPPTAPPIILGGAASGGKHPTAVEYLPMD
ncbi:MAG: kelch repeat-containing protein [Verrucomicrobiota bacterium]